ncbi:hypothetical protein ACPCG0_13655 [Propionibacteriaceae bacterium Y1923]|uniref:hypothetical protein n=1 Tax=Aestuariimicrobium sp. Y1814 TaxID=3418742 RepID=UPI003C1C01BE
MTEAPRTPATTLQTMYEDDKALDVIGYIISLKRYLVPAVVVAALVLVLGTVFALTRPDSYVANATVGLVPGAVSSEAEATQQAAMLPMVARSYSQLANSPMVLNDAAKTLDPSGELSGTELDAGLTVGWPNNSLVITFAVKADSEQEAIDRVTAIVNSFVDLVPASTGSEGGVALGANVIYLQEGPIQPEPSTTLELLAVSVVGAVALGFLVAVALDLTVGRRQRKRAS